VNYGQMSLAYAVLVEYLLSHGVTRIDKVPGCIERDVDERWSITLNGHKEPTNDSRGSSVAPYECEISYNGWPAGFVGPYGGIMAAGSGANEDTFIAALRKNMGGVRYDH
jgi:hypothetical protein